MNACEVSVNDVAKRAKLQYELVEALLAGRSKEFPNAYRRVMRTLETIMQEQGWRITSVKPVPIETSR